MDEEKKGLEPMEEKYVAMLEAKIIKIEKQREENEIMSDDTEETEGDSYPIQCISQAISYEEKIQKAISVIEGKLSILLLPPSPTKEGDTDEKERVRSPLIAEFSALNLQQIESLHMLESLTARLDL